MNKYSSDSDDSIEHMKLDLLKSKYLHQKLTNKIPSVISETKKKSCISKPKKGICNPKFSISKNGHQNRSNYLQLSEETKRQDYTDDSNISTDQDYNDIVQMNNHVDYILDRRREAKNDEINMETNPSKSFSLQQLITSSQELSADGYQKDNGDYSSAYNPSADILAQWRLRRKLIEAKSSVTTENQKHNQRINSMNIKQEDISHLSYNSYSPIMSKETVMEYECDKIPVRDDSKKTYNAAPIANIVKNSTADSGCQCNFVTKSDENLLNKQHVSTEKLTKSKHVRKTKRTIGLMTRLTTKRDVSTLTDSCNQTSVYRDSPLGFTDWEHQNNAPDYIDIAIQKTLQTQLFDRNRSPALSSITSIDESQLDIMVHNLDNAGNKLNNGDRVIPWNDDFHIESDDEFRDDDVLTDLRRRRVLNLNLLRGLSLQIQKQTGKLPAVEFS